MRYKKVNELGEVNMGKKSWEEGEEEEDKGRNEGIEKE